VLPVPFPDITADYSSCLALDIAHAGPSTRITVSSLYSET